MPRTPQPAREGWLKRAAGSARRFLLVYAALLTALSLPFWLAGSLTDRQVLPGLPASSLMFLCPLGAAAILTYRAQGKAGVAALLKRAFDASRIPSRLWYGPALLLMPALVLLAYGIMRWTGMALPEEPRHPGLEALVMFGAFVVAALSEELGWSAYATDPLVEQWGITRAGIMLGLVWGLWHVVPYLQAGRSLEWIVWCGLVETVSLRVLIVWLYRSAGRSVLAAALFHGTVNLTFFSFPNNGSHYDPRVVGLLVALTAFLVTIAGVVPGRPLRSGGSGPHPGRPGDPGAGPN